MPLKTLLRSFKANAHYSLVFVIIVGLSLMLMEENLFYQFNSISKNLHYNKKAISLHFYSDLVSTVSCLTVSYCFFNLYNRFKNKPLPLKGLLWMLCVSSVCGAALFGLDCLAIFYNFGWIEACFKVVTAAFLGGLAFLMIRTVPILKKLRTPREYAQLSDQLKALGDTYKELKEKLSK